LLNVGKKTQVHAEKTRGAGLEVTQKLSEKLEMSPVTFVRSLCKIHAVGLLCSKIADVHGIAVHDESLFLFGKVSDFYCITPET